MQQTIDIDVLKERKMAKIRKRYNQAPHPTQDTTWESNKNTTNITKSYQAFLAASQ